MDLNAEQVGLLSEADSALGELSGLGRVIPNPDLLIGPYVRREAVASSRIEGTRADLSDLLLDEADPDRRPAGSDVVEIRNYLAAMDFGLAEMQRLPIAGRLVQKMHAELLRDVRGGSDHLTPGEFRRSQNWIGPPGSTLATAIHVPPPPDQLQNCLSDWEKFVNDRQTKLPVLVQCAMMHEQFEAIHPFLDGNGRIGRLLIALFLIERGRLSKPLLYISSHIEKTKWEYYDQLQLVRTGGDWTGWLRYFLSAVRDTARDAIQQSRSILDLRDRYRSQFASRHRALVLIDALFVNPFTSISRAAGRLGVSHPTASAVIQELAKAGMLTEVSGRSYGRRWLAVPILRAIEGKPPDAMLATDAPNE